MHKYIVQARYVKRDGTTIAVKSGVEDYTAEHAVQTILAEYSKDYPTTTYTLKAFSVVELHK